MGKRSALYKKKLRVPTVVYRGQVARCPKTLDLFSNSSLAIPQRSPSQELTRSILDPFPSRLSFP